MSSLVPIEYEKRRIVFNSNTIYFYSIKHQQLIRLSSSDIRGRQQCELCIPIYPNPFFPINHKDPNGACRFEFTSLTSFIHHILSREEKRYKRPLVWTNGKFYKIKQVTSDRLFDDLITLFFLESEIPHLLERAREFGDLRTFESDEIYKLVFIYKTIIISRCHLMTYIRLNGCPCSDHLNGDQCTNKSNVLKFFLAHLASVERRDAKYVVFEGKTLSNNER